MSGERIVRQGASRGATPTAIARSRASATGSRSGRSDDAYMTVFDQTTASLRALAAQAGTAEDVMFCEQRPLTSREAQFAGRDHLASQLRELEDEAIRALKRLVDAENGYETALQSIEDAGTDATGWLRAVM